MVYWCYVPIKYFCRTCKKAAILWLREHHWLAIEREQNILAPANLNPLAIRMGLHLLRVFQYLFYKHSKRHVGDCIYLDWINYNYLFWTIYEQCFFTLMLKTTPNFVLFVWSPIFLELQGPLIFEFLCKSYGDRLWVDCLS